MIWAPTAGGQSPAAAPTNAGLAEQHHPAAATTNPAPGVYLIICSTLAQRHDWMFAARPPLHKNTVGLLALGIPRAAQAASYANVSVEITARCPA
jgi:hypothetical protein